MAAAAAAAAAENASLAPQRNFHQAYMSLISRGSALRLHSRSGVVRVMEHYLRRLDLLLPSSVDHKYLPKHTVKTGSPRTLDSLKIIHIAGSKGKGSTCVQTEALLRARGMKTGLFTSPHLIDLRERFRINGKPVDNDTFLKYFWFVWDRLHIDSDGEEFEATENENESAPRKVPGFFRFMTLLAFKIFAAENVDVAIIEVGIGGRLDATNVISSPVVCGISLIDLDHVQILGSTLAEIAAEKAGIMKPGVPCYTIPQHESAMKSLIETADAIDGCELESVTPLEAYSDGCTLQLGLAGRHQRTNAALAVALSRYFLRRTSPLLQSHSQESDLSHKAPLCGLERRALADCRWPGRCQTVRFDTKSPPMPFWLLPTSDPSPSSIRTSNSFGIPLRSRVRFHLDGAHTLKSTRSCIHWFEESCCRESLHSRSESRPPALRVLMYNCSHERNVGEMLSCLFRGDSHQYPDETRKSTKSFDAAIFCPADVGRPTLTQLPSLSSILQNMGLKAESTLSAEEAGRLPTHEITPSTKVESKASGKKIKWQKLMSLAWDTLRHQCSSDFESAAKLQETNLNLGLPRLRGGWSHVFTSIDDALGAIAHEANAHHCEIDVLVTGSLYLVGGVLQRCGWDADVGFKDLNTTTRP